MAAYIIVDVTITDPDLYNEYKSMTLETLTPFQGTFIVRGGETEILEGEWQPGRLVILSFPSRDMAKGWWDSEAYAFPKSIRQRASVTNMVLVEGV